MVALRALGAERLCFIPPYVEEINRMMRDFLLAEGFQVPVMASWNEPNDNQVACISPATIQQAVRAYGTDDKTDAIFIACTLLFAGLAASTSPREMLAAVLTILSAVIVYAVFGRRRQRITDDNGVVR